MPDAESAASVVAGMARSPLAPVVPCADVVALDRDGAIPVSGASANVCPGKVPAAAVPSHPAAESPSTAAVLPHTLAGAETGALTWLPPASDRLPEVAD